MSAAERALRVVVVGPGALGEALARCLERGGASVARLGRAGPVGAPAWPPSEPADVALVTVKSYQSAAAAEGLARSPWWGAATAAVSLQNGLGNVEALSARLGAGRVAGGATTHAARRLASGAVEHVAAGDTVFGPDRAASAEARAALAGIAARLGAHGLSVTVAPAWEPLVWGKACVSCSLNPVTALLGAPNGVALERADARALVLAAAAEVATLALALSVAIDGAEAGPEEAARRAGARALAVAQETSANRSSMLQDLEALRPTEVEALSLEVARRARAIGLEAPVNETLGRLVRAREAARPDAGPVDAGNRDEPAREAAWRAPSRMCHAPGESEL